MTFRHGERADHLPKVVRPDLRQPLEREARDVCGFAVALAKLFPAPEVLFPDPGKGDDGGACIYSLAVELYAAALAAKPGARLEQRNPVTCAPEQGSRREPAETASDHDDALHGYIVSERAATSCTPATVPATYGKAIENP